MTKREELVSNPAEDTKWYAEAREHDATADLAELQLEREKRKDVFDNAQDYRNCHVVFNYDMSLDTCSMLTQTLRRMTRMYPGNPITIELNSPGGEIIAGFALYDEILRLRNTGTHITMVVRGEACSMAAILLQSADHRVCGPNARIMLHRASFGAIGSAHEVEDSVEETRQLENQIYNLLAQRTGKSARAWKNKLGKRKDVWFRAEAALEEGLIDEIG